MIPFLSLRNARDCFLGATGIFTLCMIGQVFYKVAGTVAAPLWPSSGLALALLLLGGWRLFPAISLGTIAATQSFGSPLFFSLVGSFANTMESLIGWFLMIRVFGFSTSMTRMRDLLVLMLGGGPWGTMLSALLCTWGLVASGAVQPDRIPVSALLFWTGNFLGILVFTPLVLRLSQRWRKGTLFAFTPKSLFWTAILCIVVVAGFYPDDTAHTGFIPLGYLSFPLLIWLSFEWRRDVTLALGLVTVLMTGFTATGHGPLVRYYATATYAEMTIFIAVYSISCLVLMAAVEERDQQSQLAFEHRLSAQRKEAELQGIRSSLNPHFLFNSLNVIKSLIGADPAKARDSVVALSSLLRSSFRLMEHNLITLGDELALIRSYLDLQQTRFEGRLKTVMTVAPGTEQMMVPPMILHQLVENAVKHGIEESPGPGEIRVETRTDRTHLVLTLSNTGNFDSDSGNGEGGFGLRYVREQLEALYGSAASFSIGTLRNESGKKSRVVAEIRIPLERGS